MAKTDLSGTVLSVLIAGSAGSLASTPVDSVEVGWEGFVGDKHSGLTMRANVRQPHYPRGTEIRNTRQVSIVSDTELAETAESLGLPLIEPGWLGANLLLSGVPELTRLPPGTRLFFPDRAVIVVDSENDPCTGPGREICAAYPDRAELRPQDYPKAALHRRGLVGWIERPGTIRAGDQVLVMLPAQRLYQHSN
jgi:hypothetical protein